METSADSAVHTNVLGGQDGAHTMLSKLAYCKIFLHAAKYPYGPVAGFVLGRKISENKFEMTDVLPVCHGHPAGPVFDLSLLMGDAMHEHSTVIGIYFSSGQRDSDEAPKFVNRLTKGIIARSDSCVVVQLKCALIQDPTKLAVGVTNRGNVLPFTMEQTAESIGAATDALLAENCHRRLVDFEDHMGDKTADFRNFEISQQLSA